MDDRHAEIDFDIIVGPAAEDAAVPVAYLFASAEDATTYRRRLRERAAADVVDAALGTELPHDFVGDVPVIATGALAGAVADRVVERLGEALEPVDLLAGPEQPARSRVSEASILGEVALVERAARRLRRFVRGMVARTIEVAPAPPPPQVDDPTRALARRLLARSGFTRDDL